MALFDSQAEEYDDFFKSPLGKAIYWAEERRIMRMLDLKPGLTVLDAGCGTGVFTASLVRAGLNVTGIDESEKMLEVVKLKPSLTNAKFIKCNLENLPFEDNSYDRVLCTFVLEFIKDPNPIMNELFRVLKPGGILVIATLNSKGPFAKIRKNRGIFANAFFRDQYELLKVADIKGIATTCVHFGPNTKAMFTLREFWGCLTKKTDGAAVVARFRKRVK